MWYQPKIGFIFGKIILKRGTELTAPRMPKGWASKILIAFHQLEMT
jgi:hypothetical protein